MIASGARQRFFQPAAQAVLIAPGNQGKTRGRADRRIGIGIGKAHAFFCQFVQMRCFEMALAANAEIRITHIIGKNKNNIGLADIFAARLRCIENAGRSYREGGRCERNLR